MSCSYHFGPFTLHPRRRTLSREGLAIPVTPKAFDLLLFFAQNPNRVISKDELLKAVWADSFVEEGNLTQNVFLLRKALGQKSEDSGLIATIPRKGYQFTAEVTIVNQAARAAEVTAGEFAGIAISPAHVAIKREIEQESGQVGASSSELAGLLPAGSTAQWRWWRAALFAGAIILVGASIRIAFA